jgi:hypothetical protein
MAEDNFSELIKRDAEIFVAHLLDVELLLRLLTPQATLEESASRAILETLDDIECLRFIAWCTDQNPEELGEDLTRAGVPNESAERIEKLLGRYGIYGHFLRRLNRSNQGYENELTRLSSRPVVTTFGRNAIVALQLYSHDRLVLSSNNSLDGLVTFIDMLMDTVNDTIKSINKMAPELLAKALDPETVAAVTSRVETLRQLTSTLVKKEPTSG